MTTEQQSAHADLAFLRALVEGDGRPERNFGEAYFAAGLIYGAQILLQWAEYAEAIALPGLGSLAVVVAPTVLFISYVLWINKGAGASVGANRPLNAVFMSAGLANLAILTISATVAISLEAHFVWMIYGAVVFVLQGAAWFVAFRLLRRTWMLVVALGWMASAVAMGFAIGALNIHAYIAIAVFDVFALMALPGAIIVRGASKAA
jgi:hypothetical protein